MIFGDTSQTIFKISITKIANKTKSGFSIAQLLFIIDLQYISLKVWFWLQRNVVLTLIYILQQIRILTVDIYV